MQQKIKELNAFWDRLHQFDSAQIEDAVRFAMAYLSEQIGAGNVQWVGSVQFPNDKPENQWGWRAQATLYLHHHDEIMEHYHKHRAYIENDQARAVQVEISRHAGTYRVFRFVNDMPAEWQKSPYYQEYMRGSGTYDVMVVAQPVSKNSEAGFVFHKNESRVFTDADSQFAALACAPLLYLHKAMMLYKGIGIAENALTNSEARVLKHLLKEKSESEIAIATNLSPSTVHTYATRIYRKYGVSGRQGLMALWLSF